jgi:hypothetical protein
MTGPEAIRSSLPSLGLVGTMGLFLPSLDEAWRANPDDPGLFHIKLRRGETLYIGMGLAILILTCYANGTTWPLVIGGGFMLATVMTYEQAYRKEPARQDA